MRIDNRRVEKLERVSKARKIEQTEQENEEDRSDNFNSSLAYMQKQKQKEVETYKEKETKEDKPKDRTVSDINVVKAQMEASNLGKINMLREKLNNQIHEPENPKEEVEKPEVKRARKAYEESMKMAEELER